MEKVLQVIFIVILSATKFFAAPITSLNIGFNYLQTLMLTIVGGILGVIVFYFLSNAIAFLVIQITKAILGSKMPSKPKIFTWKNRMIVNTVRKYGLLGVAIITPVLLSIPLGTFIAARYFEDRNQVFKYMCASVVFWSVIISSLVIVF